MPSSHQYALQTRLGSLSCFLVVILLLAYLITTILGLADLHDKDDPIQGPYFTTMEILILLMMAPILVALDAYHKLLGSASSWLGNLALMFLTISTAITSSVHAAVLMANHSDALQQANPVLHDYMFSFEWPSVVYSLDILAWDWFFALGMLFFGFTGRVGLRNLSRLERAIQVLFLGSGTLSLVGLIAVPMDNIQVRMMGIFGYAVVTIPLFTVLGVYIRKVDSSYLGQGEPNEVKSRDDNQDRSHSSNDLTHEG